MTLSVQGKHAVITGAGSGINLAFANLLLNQGCSVLIGDLTLRPESEALLQQFPHPSPNGGPSALFHKTDVTSWPQLTSLWKTGLETFGTVDIVVPGAGLCDPEWSSFWNAPKTETNSDSPSRDPADAEPGHYTTLDVNLVSPIRLSQLAIGHWTQNKLKGCLVHVGSVAGYTSGVGLPLYMASKHGLHSFVRSLGPLRDELGIRIGCVAPAAVKTALWKDDASKAHMVSDKILWVQPEEVAQAMLEQVVNEKYGNGSIVEVTAGATRDIPEFGLEPPSLKAVMVPGLFEMYKVLFKKLKANGLKL